MLYRVGVGPRFKGLNGLRQLCEFFRTHDCAEVSRLSRVDDQSTVLAKPENFSIGFAEEYMELCKWELVFGVGMRRAFDEPEVTSILALQGQLGRQRVRTLDAEEHAGGEGLCGDVVEQHNQGPPDSILPVFLEKVRTSVFGAKPGKFVTRMCQMSS